MTFAAERSRCLRLGFVFGVRAIGTLQNAGLMRLNRLKKLGWNFLLIEFLIMILYKLFPV